MECRGTGQEGRTRGARTWRPLHPGVSGQPGGLCAEAGSPGGPGAARRACCLSVLLPRWQAPQSQAGAAEGMAFTMASLTAALPARLRRNAAPAKAPLLVSWEGGFRRSAGVLDTPSAGASPTQRRQRVVATRREPSSQACAASRARLPCRGLWRPRVLATAGALFRALADAALLSQTARLRWVLTTGASGP